MNSLSNGGMSEKAPLLESAFEVNWAAATGAFEFRLVEAGGGGFDVEVELFARGFFFAFALAALKVSPSETSESPRSAKDSAHECVTLGASDTHLAEEAYQRKQKEDRKTPWPSPKMVWGQH